MTQTSRRFSQLAAVDKADTIARWLEEHKARNLLVLDVHEKSSLTDVVVIASVSSVRQGQSLAEGLLTLCREENFEFFHTEGQNTGQWILVDLNDVVVHLFQDDARTLYNLEGLWRDTPVIRGSRAPAPAGAEQA